MYQLVYASKYRNLNTFDIVQDIVQKSKKNNRKHNITGVLVFSSGYFLQCIEGDRTAINKLYYNICNDKRHFNVNLLRYDQISERSFPFWTMAFASETEENKKIYFKYGMNKFNPFKISYEGLLPFLRQLGFIYSDEDAYRSLNTKAIKPGKFKKLRAIANRSKA